VCIHGGTEERLAREYVAGIAAVFPQTLLVHRMQSSPGMSRDGQISHEWVDDASASRKKRIRNHTPVPGPPFRIRPFQPHPPPNPPAPPTETPCCPYLGQTREKKSFAWARPTNNDHFSPISSATLHRAEAHLALPVSKSPAVENVCRKLLAATGACHQGVRMAESPIIICKVAVA